MNGLDQEVPAVGISKNFKTKKKMKKPIHYYWLHTLCVLAQGKDLTPGLCGVSLRPHELQAKSGM